ncbi:MAG: hypothetical protein H6710_20365 [Myxococcales bacterium]|nr:hypothetical protein [Myxococcales bacterium]
MRIDYRVYFDGEAASSDELAAIESIVVDQEIDVAWEARLQIAICADSRGNWREGDRYADDFTRVRIELRLGNDNFAPLIDGPVVIRDSDLSSEPGRSSLALTVRDDSVYLNRRAAPTVFEESRDSAIARAIFDDCSQIDDTEIDDTEPAEGDRPAAGVQQGTAIEALRALARRHGMNAYVRPGDQAGRSVGVFRRPPTRAGDLPEIVTRGGRRNVDRIQVEVNSERPARVIAETLSLGDKTVIRRRSSARELELLGEDEAVAEGDQGEERLLPGQAGATDLQSQVDGEAARRSYAVRITGETSGTCYAGILRPYEVVRLRGATARISGDYTITKVTHNLGRARYTQAFTLRSNSRASADAQERQAAQQIPQGVF